MDRIDPLSPVQDLMLQMLEHPPRRLRFVLPTRQDPVAAGFALKDLVASVVAGLIILMDRPFQAGDRVTFAGYYGEITHIGLRSVRLMTLDDTQVTIPNNLLLTEAVASGNAGAVDMMIQVDLYIGIDQNLEEAQRLLGEVVTTSRYVNLNRPWAVCFE